MKKTSEIVCANCGIELIETSVISGGSMEPEEACCSMECYEELENLGCPLEHGNTFRPRKEQSND